MQFFKKIKALGSEIEIWLLADSSQSPSGDLKDIEKEIIIFEKKFSRFIDSSEISQLNKSNGQFKTSQEMIDILTLAKKFYTETEKVFDPTIAITLERLGYEKSFDRWDDIFTHNNKPEKKTAEINFEQVKIDNINKIINIPKKIKVDLGGIGKGYIADKISRKLLSKGYNNFWISIGGDMFLTGLNEEKKFHKVGIQNPLKHNEDILKIEVKDKYLAIATSGITKRFWKKWNKKWHHLIDPKTGSSAENDLLAVTIVAPNTTSADVFAKVVFILGKEKGMEFINKRKKIEGVIIDKNLNIILSKNMPNYLV